MAASSSLSLAAAVVLLLLAVSAVDPAAAGSGNHGGARTMVIVIRRGSGTKAAAAGARASDNEWRYGGRGRLLEDEVAPELGGLFGAGEDRSLSYGALDQTRPACPSSGQCAAQGTGSYTRPCTYKDHCPH